MKKFKTLTKDELMNTEGGIEPITIVLGVGTLALATFNAGYRFGADIARRGR